VIIAPSYADIFYNNCFKNGILPVTLAEEEVEELFKRTEAGVGYELTADLPNQIVSDSSGLKFSFEIDPFRKRVLLKGLDDIGLTLEHEPDITAFEKKRNPHVSQFAAVDMKAPQG
jgi:3-isopropylmalate/(R)-2-methylmalate dehydratase small subunit